MIIFTIINDCFTILQSQIESVPQFNIAFKIFYIVGDKFSSRSKHKSSIFNDRDDACYFPLFCNCGRYSVTYRSQNE